MKTLHIIPKTDDTPSSSLSVCFSIPKARIADVFKTEGQAQVSRDEKKEPLNCYMKNRPLTRERSQMDIFGAYLCLQLLTYLIAEPFRALVDSISASLSRSNDTQRTNKNEKNVERNSVSHEDRPAAGKVVQRYDRKLPNQESYCKKKNNPNVSLIWPNKKKQKSSQNDYGMISHDGNNFGRGPG